MVVKKLLISLKKTILIKKIKYKYKLFPFKLKKNIFDFIISLESIEHIEDDHTFIDTLVAALKPNGILILSTPNEEKQSLKLNPNKFHYRHYITKDMIKKLENFDLGDIFHQVLKFISEKVNGDFKNLNTKQIHKLTLEALSEIGKKHI